MRLIFSGYVFELPEYESKEKLKEKLLVAIYEAAEGFYIG